jgi:hypothetical protein
VCDYLVGGKDNFTADRVFAGKILGCAPKAPFSALANRVPARGGAVPGRRGGPERVDIACADIRDPARVLADPAVLSLIDFDRPVGLLMLAILHHVEDRDDPARIAVRFREAMPAGSYLAISSFRMPGAEAGGWLTR